MSAGITAYGAYIPLYRLDRKLIADTWSVGHTPGERSVANFDEDSTTMAVSAAVDCINGLDRNKIDGLYFATTTSPYKEKQAAATIATALDLRKEVLTADFTGSLRAGTIALKAAIDAVNAGSARQVIVTAADCRLASPQTNYEQTFGDGAAAFVVGDTDIAVTIEGSYSFYDEFFDVWRREEDTYVKFWEERFILTEGYNRNMKEAFAGLLRKLELVPRDFIKVVYYAPDARSHAGIAGAFKFDPKTQVQPPLFDKVGNTGTAFAPMMLVAALEEAKPGDRILFVGYGDGADAFSLCVTEQIEKLKDNRRGIKGHLASKKLLPSYGKYLAFRKLLALDIGEYTRPASSVSRIWRDYDGTLRLHGARCKRCGNVVFPIYRVCAHSQAKDEYEEVRLSDRKGEVFTFTWDATIPSVIDLDGPLTSCQVNFEGGGRMITWMTDKELIEVKIGMPVEMTFRRLYDAAGFHNYYWKSRPIR
jgi:3-hydroxy-3-methylglutaryl CoA synthase